MLTEYLCLDTGEIANNARVKAYARKLGLLSIKCACPSLADNTGGPFTSPDADDAPWYQETIPASAEFAGVYVQEVTGLDGSTNGVEVATLPNGFGSPSARRPAPRTIGVTLTLVAATERALNYGLQWLDGTLTAESCAPACLGNSLQFFAHCEDTVPMIRRYLYDVALTSGPTETLRKQIKRSGCTSWLATVELTIVASNPYIYMERQITYTQQFDSQSVPGCDVRWYEVDQGCPDGINCNQGVAAGFLDDPNCGVAITPPAYATEEDDCGCSTRYVSASGVIALRSEPDAAEPTPEFAAQVPVIEIDAGGKEMRRLTVRFFRRDSVDDDCTDVTADPCDACAELNVPYLPGGASLIVDGRLRRAIAIQESSGAMTDASHLLRSNGGARWDWPAIVGPNLCAQIMVDGLYYSPTASVSISMVPVVSAA